MHIPEPSTELRQAAVDGDLASLDRLILLIQPGVFNLAVRMLGNRDDAAEATQEILLKVVTHLAAFRGESAFATWVFRVAKNHLLTAATRTRESPQISLEALAADLDEGMAMHAQLGSPYTQRPLQPEEKVEARQIALGCTQKMLMALDRDKRLSYILDVVFGLSSDEAGRVLDISPEAHRQRLARAKAALDGFASASCGLVSASAPCTCAQQIPAVRHVRAAQTQAAAGVIAIHATERDEAERHFEALLRLGDASAMFRAHPAYRAPDAMRAAIRAVLSAEGLLPPDRPRH